MAYRILPSITVKREVHVYLGIIKLSLPLSPNFEGNTFILLANVHTPNFR